MSGDFDRLGLSYDAYDRGPLRFTRIRRTALQSSRLAQYDIIFFNCGMDDTWAYGFGGISLNEVDRTLGNLSKTGDLSMRLTGPIT